MTKPVYLLSSGFALVAFAALQISANQTTPPQFETTPQVSLQRTVTHDSTRIITLSGSETNTLSQPQRWVF